MTMWRRAMLYLGLGPDDDYDEDVLPDERAPRAPGARATYPLEGEISTVRPIPAREARRPDGSVGRPGSSGDPLAYDPAVDEAPAMIRRPRPGSGSVVRTIPTTPSSKPVAVTPSSFNQAQEVADHFRDGTPVIMNLQLLDRDLSRRLIDFASGLCYGLSGKMDKVADGVFLLTPANVEVSAEDRRRINERDLRD